MSINVDFLKEICEATGAPGYEGKVREIVIREITSLVDEYKVDNLGNIICIKNGVNKNTKGAKKVMVAAHMDEIGFIVTHIDDKGFVRFHTLGGFDAKTLTAQRIIIHGKKNIVGVMGTKPIHLMSQEEKLKPLQISDFFIDVGMSKKETEKVISIGDTITRDRKLIEMGECVNCKSLDNRVSVFILIEVLKEIKKNPYDVYAVFTVQEEVGLRGATVAAHSINPDFGFGLDVTIANDLPSAEDHEKVTCLGAGTAIKIMDSSTICDHRMVEFMKKTADKHKIKWQPEVLTAGGTDTAGIQRMGKNGAIAGAISIPTRYLHQVIEMANKKDIRASIDLLKHCLEDIDQNNWTH